MSNAIDKALDLSRRSGSSHWLTTVEVERCVGTGELTGQSSQWLIGCALQFDDLDSEARWHAVWMLQSRGTADEFTLASQFCRSDDPHRRCLGADIIAQGRTALNTFHDDAVTLLLDMFRMFRLETNTAVLGSIASAFGHRGDLRSLDALLHLATHCEAQVRFPATVALSHLNDDRAIAALISLSTDLDADVRDWATFGLGTIREETDTPEIREALFARLSDSDQGTRDEAMVGLALRHDNRVVQPLAKAIRQGWDDFQLKDAVEALPDPVVLHALAEAWDSLGDHVANWSDEFPRREWSSS